MTAPPRILLIDSLASDLELAALLLARDIAGAEVIRIGDTPTLIEALRGPPAQVAVLAARLKWADVGEILGLLRSQAADTAIVVFGEHADIVERCLNPGLALAGVANKTTAGFLALSGIVADALARGRTRTTAAAGSNGGGLELADLPLPAFFAHADGRLADANDAFLALGDMRPSALHQVTVAELCANEDARRTWQAFRDRPTGQIELELDLGRAGLRRAHLNRNVARARGQCFFAAVADASPATINVVNTSSQERARSEMHDIALVFSHDLKEPVQQIMRLTRRLQEGGSGDDQARLTQQLETCATRATGMLGSMLEYLSVSARDERPGLVDLNHCLEEALDNLRATIDESGAQIISDQLPSIAGDPYQLVHLFQNLIGNAIKFHGRERPEVRITAESAGEYWRVTVHDNGIGIDEGFREQVFEMGKRLHTRDEYPGAGIGLTLCRRIAERHGGTIRIETGESAGTNVIIEVPRTPQHVTRLA